MYYLLKIDESSYIYGIKRDVKEKKSHISMISNLDLLTWTAFFIRVGMISIQLYMETNFGQQRYKFQSVVEYHVLIGTVYDLVLGVAFFMNSIKILARLK